MRKPEKITRRIGQAFHVPGFSINTDAIIPAERLKEETFPVLGEFPFENVREAALGKHPFDLPENQSATTLVVDEDFGSGSSREHAPQALLYWKKGIQTLIGRSFANIFRDNCNANGMICVDVDAETHASIVAYLKREHPMPVLQVDLEKMEILGTVNDVWSCTMPEADRDSLLNGTWDPMAVLVGAKDEIAAVLDSHSSSRIPVVA